MSGDRRAARQIAVAFGLIFLALAYSSMFPALEVWVVAAGALMLTAGALLWTPLPTAVTVIAAPAATAVLVALLALDRLGWR